MKVGVIDVGTNSCRMLAADCRDGVIEEIKRDLVITRLGEGVDQNGFLLDTAIERASSAIFAFVKEMDKLDVGKIRIIGTSVLRDVNNAESLVQRIKDETGCTLDIIPGREEARLTYLGAGVSDPDTLIIDIGGGSTEFIWQDNQGINFRSLDIGAVRLTERFINNPQERVSNLEISLIEREVRELLNREIAPIHIDKAVGLGGTITTIAAIEQEMGVYDSGKIEGYKISIGSLKKTINRLKEMSLKERKEVKGLQEERADIIVAGAVILSVIMETLGLKDLYASEHDLLYGTVKDMIM